MGTYELFASRDLTQEESATAHVAASHECDGKAQTLAEDIEQHVHILWRGDAAEQHDLAFAQIGKQLARAVFEWSSIVVVRQVDRRR